MPGRLPLAALGLLIALAAPQVAWSQGRTAQPGVRSNMLVSTAWLAERLGDPNLVVLHVAWSREVYERTHVPGARFVYWTDVAVTRREIPNQLPPAEELAELFTKLGVAPGRRVIIYSEDAGLMAARVYVALDYLGAAGGAALLDGQWAKWTREGRPTTAETPAAAEARFVPQVNPDVIVTLQVMHDLVWEASASRPSRLAIIDARPEVEYSGERPGAGVLRRGHIPGAANIFWMRNVVSEENPVLRPASELRRMYADAGARTDGLVITYCRSGGQSSHAYFVAKYLGFDVKIYDGSFIEWSRAEETPVAQ